MINSLCDDRYPNSYDELMEIPADASVSLVHTAKLKINCFIKIEKAFDQKIQTLFQLQLTTNSNHYFYWYTFT